MNQSIDLNSSTSATGDDRLYEALLRNWLSSAGTNLADNLATHFPRAVYAAYHGARGGVYTHSETTAFWDGAKLLQVAWPDDRKVWADDYAAFASRVVAIAKTYAPEPVTVIDLGSGMGIVGLNIALQSAGNIRLINIDFDSFAVEFGEALARHHSANVEYIRLNIAQSLENDAAQLKAALSGVSGRKILISRGGLHPLYSNEQYQMLFDVFINRLGCDAGAHFEFTGFRTKTFEEIQRHFPARPQISAFWNRPDDPISFLLSNTERLNIEIMDRIEIWPHYLGVRMPCLSHWPSYLSWRR